MSKRLLTNRATGSRAAKPSARPPRHARLRRVTAQDRQASLIGAAASLFAAKGFSGTTTKDIAKAAGVSEALLFKHFPTKHALYRAILTEKAQYAGLRQNVEAAARTRDDRRVFTILASFRIRKHADPTLLRLLLFSALEGHDLSHMFFEEQYRVFYDLLAGYLAQRTAEGAFRAVDPLLAARAFFGILVHHRLLHDIFDLPLHRSHEEMVEAYVDLFLHGLLAPSDQSDQEAHRPT